MVAYGEKNWTKFNILENLDEIMKWNAKMWKSVAQPGFFSRCDVSLARFRGALANNKRGSLTKQCQFSTHTFFSAQVSQKSGLIFWRILTPPTVLLSVMLTIVKQFFQASFSGLVFKNPHYTSSRKSKIEIQYATYYPFHTVTTKTVVHWSTRRSHDTGMQYFVGDKKTDFDDN